MRSQYIKLISTILAAFFINAHSGRAAPAPPTLWYTSPAAKGMNEALPIGNGRFGALIYGGVDTERLVLNEDSLWTGTEISSDAYGKMGAYQMLGELLLSVGGGSTDPVTEPVVSCPSGHKAFYDSEDIASSVDGTPETKWCVEHHGKPVVWEVRLPKAVAVSRCSFTSANDVPSRDPQTWTFDGSDDGKNWTTLDRHSNEPPFENRGETKTYSFHNTAAYRFYRFTFQPIDPMRFQLAEISLQGVKLPNAPAASAVAAQSYRRSLDLATAIHTVTYTIGGTTFRREAFASHADGVIVMKFSGDKPGACTGTIKLAGAHGETTQAKDNTLEFSGALNNGLKYETKLVALHEGGSLHAGGGSLGFKNCDSLTLILAAGTDYSFNYANHYRGSDPSATIEKRLAAAAAKPYAKLKAAHVADYQSLFNRVSLDVGKTPADRLALPIDRRKMLEAQNGGDPELEALMFQYGRYLMISCSRPGGLPANLQGLWNDRNNPPWHSDYHANINVQMNYWPAEPANLSECHLPLFDLIESQLPAWRKATAAEKQFQTGPFWPIRRPDSVPGGWAIRTSHGINGDEAWQWDITADAWYCQHFWWHYDFTQDKAWLKEVAYPVIKEVTGFWEARLKKLPDGRYVVPHGWSPEHGPREDGVSYCQEIIWDLFNNYVKASEVLGVDADYRAKITAMRDALVVPKIGHWGQLQEWMEDRDSPNDHHRHTSHLFAVFPGNQIDVAHTPKLAAAAKVSLDARGVAPNSDVREWSFAWRCALYARLHDGEDAHKMLQMLLANRNTCLNLFGLHPPMQIDGDFGITASVCEMLMQSQAGEIDLLPALPKCWPTGKVTGLRARGGFTVDIAWKDGQVTAYRITSAKSKFVTVRVNGKVTTAPSSVP